MENVCRGCGALNAKVRTMYGGKNGMPYCTKECADTHHFILMGKDLGAQEERLRIFSELLDYAEGVHPADSTKALLEFAEKLKKRRKGEV